MHHKTRMRQGFENLIERGTIGRVHRRAKLGDKNAHAPTGQGLQGHFGCHFMAFAGGGEGQDFAPRFPCCQQTLQLTNARRARLAGVKRPVDEIEQHFGVEESKTGIIRPQNPQPLGIPKPGGVGVRMPGLGVASGVSHGFRGLST